MTPAGYREIVASAIADALGGRSKKLEAQTCNCMHFSSRTKPTMLEPERMGKIQCRGLIYVT